MCGGLKARTFGDMYVIVFGGFLCNYSVEMVWDFIFLWFFH